MLQMQEKDLPCSTRRNHGRSEAGYTEHTPSCNATTHGGQAQALDLKVSHHANDCLPLFPHQIFLGHYTLVEDEFCCHACTHATFILDMLPKREPRHALQRARGLTENNECMPYHHSCAHTTPVLTPLHKHRSRHAMNLVCACVKPGMPSNFLYGLTETKHALTSILRA